MNLNVLPNCFQWNPKQMTACRAAQIFAPRHNAPRHINYNPTNQFRTLERETRLRAVLKRDADVFSKHKADTGCCNFVEHEIELKEGAIRHKEGARRMTPHNSDACRAAIEILLEYDMKKPSKSPLACGVVMAKKKRGQLSSCCDFR